MKALGERTGSERACLEVAKLRWEGSCRLGAVAGLPKDLRSIVIGYREEKERLGYSCEYSWLVGVKGLLVSLPSPTLK